MEQMILQDICKVYDCPHTTAKDEGIGIPLVRTPNIGKGRLLLTNAHRVNSDIYQERTRRAIPEEDDIIIAREAPVGNAAIIQMGQKVCLGQRVVLLKPIRDRVDPNYLVYYLLSDEIQHRLRIHANGAVVAHLNMADIRNLPVSLPSLSEQKKIGRVLKIIDDKIELNRRINDNLEQQAQLLFDNLIDASDWSTTQFLSELSEINPPRKLSKGEYAPFVEMSNMPTSGSFPSRIDYKEYNGGMKFRNGDTIMARITPCLENGKAAYVNFLKENEIGFGSTEYIVLAPKKTISSSFLYFLVRNKEFVDYAVKHMNGSSGRQRVSGDTIGNYQLPILDRNKLSIFIAIADRTLSKIRQNSFEILNLAKQRDTLLPKLMSGELKINDLNC